MELIGTVARVQVQCAPLKPRPPGSGRYDPAPLLQVAALEVGPSGCVGLVDGRRLLDVHHVDHPLSRNVRGVNGLSVLPSGHYLELRRRYGNRLADGVAGENMLLERAGRTTETDLAGPLLLESRDGSLPAHAVMAAPPCVEFSRFALGRDDLEIDEEIRATLDTLDGGTRGFYLRVAATGVVEPGARLLRPA